MGTAGQSITLANSIIGVGILAMPFCFQKCGVVLATLILLSMGLVSRLCCYFLLKSALLARRRNFEFLAFHVFGPAGKMAVEVGIIGFLMGTCIAYFVVVGDLGPQIIAKMLNINQSDILRTSIMVIVSLVCVLPLGLLRNVDSLSNVSAATIGFYFCLVMKVIAEAASQLLTGEWHTRMEMWKPSGFLQCVPIFSMALFCQTQLFEIFESLPSLSLEKMNLVTKNAINICTGVYFTLGLFGYIAFCSQEISGNILMSLSPTMTSDVIKLGFVMSLAFSFPLIIFPCRASLYSFLYKKVHSSHHDHMVNHSIPERSFRCITVAIIAVALFISLLIPNIELVLGLVGSTIGVLICVVFPAACFVNVTFKNTNERVLAKAILLLGLIIMVLGTYANLQAAETQLDRYDDKYITQERIDKIVEDFFEKRGKLEEIKVKPLPESVPNPPDPIIIDNNIIKDSEVQPPNPVPPDMSNEKVPNNPIKELKEKHEVIKTSAEKLSELHPKDVKAKLNEALLQNGNSHEENKEEKPKEVNNAKPANDDKIHMLKQQELIEKIKQHGEEQQELIKEKKEIVDEILKTKKELQENRDEVGSAEAKKIAVESIKQIANMAIKSIGGVSEKPDGPAEEVQKSEGLGKLTNNAVLEIAKKAAEAIQEIEDKRSDPAANPAKGPGNPINEIPILNIIQNSMNSQGNVENGDVIKDDPVPNIAESQIKEENINPKLQDVIANEQNRVPSVEQEINLEIMKAEKHDIEASEVKPELGSNSNLKQSETMPNKEEQAAVNIKQLDTQNRAEINADVESKTHNVQQQNLNKPVKTKSLSGLQPHIEKQATADLQQDARSDKDIQNNNVINKKPKLLNQPSVKAHSHSPDEPQSYKQGEDSQKIDSKPSLQNLVLPPVNNDITVRNEVQNGKILKKPEASAKNKPDSNANIGGNIQPNVQNDLHSRQKRDIEDCPKKVEVKEIYRNVIDNKLKNSEDILPPVDFNGALKRQPVDPSLMHHIVRSLKMYNEMDKKR
ncbi:putative sodium-coupled neutral amino acid transporter 10 [Manduca sexta]|uniref:Amino acid transporter transmembrane domain-containing protein n=1 Tax=Manduca sexta TaxID=7130 RepID=A0A921ZE39_MANSE|nr:putative sodium-coupled neutral amino acid transporter 10 [Manduca sexta]KAG6455147.1 hypothetical protein O3G_MSEX009060 [Manduca sexta]